MIINREVKEEEVEEEEEEIIINIKKDKIMSKEINHKKQEEIKDKEEEQKNDIKNKFKITIINIYKCLFA